MEEIQSSVPLDTVEEETVAIDDNGEQTQVAAPDQVDSSAMGKLPVEDWDYQQPKRGEIRTGVILAITDSEIIVDVGAKRDGIVPFADLQRMDAQALSKMQVGDKVPVCVLRPEDQDGNLMVSLYQARQENDWLRAKELAETGDAWEGVVEDYNKGGLVIALGAIRGFLPASQVARFPANMTQEERMSRLSGMVGEKLLVKVIELNRRKHRLILSATAAQRERRQRARSQLLSDMREGEVRRGTVSSLCQFGAFVDLGGADGLIHLSELTWRRVRHPKEVLRVGDTVDVLILKLDRERNRIGLSRKRLQPEPWALIEDNYELGQLVEGVVTNVVDFGAFAEIESGVEGLVHVSELTEKSITHPREVVKRGERLLLRIIRIDTRRKRLGLSLKRVLESELSEWQARNPAPPRREPQPARAARPAKHDVAVEPAGDVEAEEQAFELEPASEAEAEEQAFELEPASEAEAEEQAFEPEPAGEVEAEEQALELEPAGETEAEEQAFEPEPASETEAEAEEQAFEPEPASEAEAEEQAFELEPGSDAESMEQALDPADPSQDAPADSSSGSVEQPFLSTDPSSGLRGAEMNLSMAEQ